MRARSSRRPRSRRASVAATDAIPTSTSVPRPVDTESSPRPVANAARSGAADSASPARDRGGLDGRLRRSDAVGPAEIPDELDARDVVHDQSTGSSRISGVPVALSASPGWRLPARPAASPPSTISASAVPSSSRMPSASIATTRPPTRTRSPDVSAEVAEVDVPRLSLAGAAGGRRGAGRRRSGGATRPSRGSGAGRARRAGRRRGLAEHDVGAPARDDGESTVRRRGIRPLHDAGDRGRPPDGEVGRGDPAAREARDRDATAVDLELGGPSIAALVDLDDRAGHPDQPPFDGGRRGRLQPVDRRLARAEDPRLVRPQARRAPGLARPCPSPEPASRAASRRPGRRGRPRSRRCCPRRSSAGRWRRAGVVPIVSVPSTVTRWPACTQRGAHGHERRLRGAGARLRRRAAAGRRRWRRRGLGGDHDVGTIPQPQPVAVERALARRPLPDDAGQADPAPPSGTGRRRARPMRRRGSGASRRPTR